MVNTLFHQKGAGAQGRLSEFYHVSLTLQTNDEVTKLIIIFPKTKNTQVDFFANQNQIHLV